MQFNARVLEEALDPSTPLLERVKFLAIFANNLDEFFMIRVSALHRQVRGICCLRPGVPGVSDTITVTSIVGRFLEHARIYYFRNGGADDVLLGSADLMPRNLDHRVELLFPVEQPQLRDLIIQDILRVHLHDNVQARRLLSNGDYERLRPHPDDNVLSSQDWLLQHWKDRSHYPIPPSCG